MKSRWHHESARACNEDFLKLRVYTSRLLGQEPDLVLHGGGNTSVKTRVKTLLGERVEVLHVKGSGWDLATIEAAGFAPVRLEVLKALAELEQLTDSEMVRQQRAAMLNPYAPNPSVEAILHAIIPARFVDHTHADAVVTLTNTPAGEGRIREVYGDRVLVVPYVMPGFVLARRVRELTRDFDWSRCEGIILLNHGVFTFADDARAAYEKMISLVSEAEDYLATQGAIAEPGPQEAEEDLHTLARLRREISRAKGSAMIVSLDASPSALRFSAREDVASIATRGPLTPDHVIRTKRTALILGGDPGESVDRYTADYRSYFRRNDQDGAGRVCLDTAPRWAVWPGYGTLAFGSSPKEARIVGDIVEHTRRAIERAESLESWRPLPESDIFDVEYWELEQAKLKKAGGAKEMQGKVALVTGAAGGIGRACAERLHRQGAVVVGLDLDDQVVRVFDQPSWLGLQVDVTDEKALAEAVATAVRRFGGLDIVIGNAGIFPAGQTIEQLEAAAWQRSLAVNLTSQQQLLKHSVPFLQQGIDPAVVIVASRNVPAPGPGAAAYSVAKAGLTQLARVAALELGPTGVRVNVVHPDCVFDTGVWTEEVLGNRAKHYGLTVEQYKQRNLLRTQVSSNDVARLVCAMAGATFAKTTGAQVPIDGGNDRVV